MNQHFYPLFTNKSGWLYPIYSVNGPLTLLAFNWALVRWVQLDLNLDPGHEYHGKSNITTAVRHPFQSPRNCSSLKPFFIRTHFLESSSANGLLKTSLWSSKMKTPLPSISQKLYSATLPPLHQERGSQPAAGLPSPSVSVYVSNHPQYSFSASLLLARTPTFLPRVLSQLLKMTPRMLSSLCLCAHSCWSLNYPSVDRRLSTRRRRRKRLVITRQAHPYFLLLHPVITFFSHRPRKLLNLSR